MADYENQQVLSPISQDNNALPSTALAISLARAEIDTQISTAKQYPRSLTDVKNDIHSLVTMDAETAQECTYALPRGGKPITGPSIRFAEIVASQYGNCRQGAQLIDVDRDAKMITCEGVFHDLEKNTATKKTVQRRISGKDGKIFSDDMIIVTINAACSIALRNAILGGVPKALWRKAHETALKVMKGDIKTLAERRPAAMTAFAAFGIKPEQIFLALGKAGIEDIDLDDLATLTGMISGLKSGDVTVEEMFPVTKPAQDATAKPANIEVGDGDVVKRGQKAVAAEDKPKPKDAPVASQKEPERTAEPAGDAPDTIEPDETPHNPETGEVLEGEVLGAEPAQQSVAIDPNTYSGRKLTHLKSLPTGNSLEAGLKEMIAEKDFKLMEDMDEHLDLYAAIQQLPAFARIDDGSLIKSRIKSGY